MDHGSDIDFRITRRDWVLGILTAPLFMWVLMFAVSGAERLLASPRSRLRIYLTLLAIEVVLIALVVRWVAG